MKKDVVNVINFGSQDGCRSGEHNYVFPGLNQEEVLAVCQKCGVHHVIKFKSELKDE